MMQSWRYQAAQKSEARLTAASHCTHITPRAATLLHGHFSAAPGRVSAAVNCSHMSAALDVHMLQRAMQCAQGLSKVFLWKNVMQQTKPAPMTQYCLIISGVPAAACECRVHAATS